MVWIYGMDAKSLWVRALIRLADPRCSLCGLSCERLDWPLCMDCFSHLPLWLQGCSCCGMPLSGLHLGQPICGDCQHRPPPFRRMRLLGWYQGELKDLILRFKFYGDFTAGKALSYAWLQHNTITEKPDCIIPVPCHPHKLVERGFNQAAVIAHHFSKSLEIPMDQTICKRLLAGHDLIGQSRVARLAQVKPLYRSNPCPYHHVALVDDVVTTQATSIHLANQLLQQGAQRVEIWSLARTP